MTPDFLWDTSSVLRETVDEMRAMGIDDDVIDMIIGAADNCDVAACGMIGREAAA
jgi:hypothetical protein